MTEFIAIVASHIFLLYIVLRAAKLALKEDQQDVKTPRQLPRQ